MSKSLQKGILIAVCVALVLAIALTAAIFAGGGDKSPLSMQEGQASNVAQNNTTYTHGSNIGRSVPSGVTTVNNATDFLSALRNNQSISLLNDITLPSENTFPRSSSALSLDYSGTVYGNGYTVSFVGKHDTDGGEWTNPQPAGASDADWNTHVNYFGGIVGQLLSGGHIYDLNVVMTSGSIAFKTNDKENSQGDTWLDVGGIAGIVKSGASIENCTFSINDSSSRMAALKYPRATVNQWSRAGGIAGELDGGSIINCTVTNNGWIESGEAGKNNYTAGNSYHSAVGNIVGWINSGTIDNVRVAGSGNLKAFKAAGIGVINSSAGMTTSNYYNNFTGTYTVMYSGNGGGSSAAYASSGSQTATVTNYFNEGATGTSGATTITNTLQIPSSRSYELYFDPTVSSRANSLAVEFNQTPDSTRTYTLTSGNGTQYTDYTDVNNKIIFRNLPTAAATWNSGGNFTATLTSAEAIDPNDYPALTKYEHGYLAESDRTTTGTAISTGAEFEALFQPSGGASGQSGTYYLTDDIVITGFTGISFPGTLDGNGHTIFITGARTTLTGANIGGLVGELTGTIKNLRVVFATDLSPATSNGNARFGGVVGNLNGGTIENVMLYSSHMFTSPTSGTDKSFGGIAGTSTGGIISNTTVYFDNAVISPSSNYVWNGGFIGKVDGKTNLKNIILRGNVEFRNAASSQGQFIGAVAAMNVSNAVTSSTDPRVEIDGLIYDFTYTMTNASGYSTNTETYGMFVNNGTSTNVSNIGNYGVLVDESNIFIVGDSTDYPYGAKDDAISARANTYIPINVNASILSSVTDFSGAAVTAYFVTDGDNYDNITLVAEASDWNGVDQLKSDGNVNALSVDDGNKKVVTVAKANAATDNRITLSQYVPGTVVTLDSASSLTYNASEQDATFTITGAELTVDTDYTVTYAVDSSNPNGAMLGENNKPLNAGNYIATITLNDGNYYFHVGGAYDKSATIQVTVSPAELTLASDLATTLAGTYGDYTYTYGGGDYTVTIGENVQLFTEAVDSSAYTVLVTGGSHMETTGGLLPADTYTFRVKLTSGNYTFADSNVTADISDVVVAPYKVQGTWTISGLTITYGDAAPDIDKYVSVTLTSIDIPDGLTEVTASGFTSNYTQGIDAGTTVDVTAVGYAVGEGFLASNYDFSGIEGSGSVDVQKRELTISLIDQEYTPHISATYGSTGDKSAVQALLNGDWDDINAYINNVYGEDEITFTITGIYVAAYDEESKFVLDTTTDVSDNAANFSANSYLITVTSDDENYTVADGQFFVYGVIPATLTVTGVSFADDFDGVYDGNAHEVEVQFSGLVGGNDAYDFGISISGVEGTSVTNAGVYTVTVYSDEENVNYDLSFKNADGESGNEYRLTVTAKTLAIGSISGTYTDYAAVDITNELAAKQVSGILSDDAQDVTVTAAWDSLNYEGGYLAEGTYTATLSLDGDKAGNYTFGENSTLTLTVSAFDLSGATVKITSSDLTYNGSEQTVTYTVSTAAENGKDITALVSANGSDKQTNAGDHTLTISGDHNFKGEVTVSWSIAKKDVTVSWTVEGAVTQGMTAEQVKALAKVTDNGEIYDSDTFTFGVDLGEYSEATAQGETVTFTPSVTFTDNVDKDNYTVTFDPATIVRTVQYGTITIGVKESTVSKDYVNGFTTAEQFLANFTTDQGIEITSADFRVTVTPVDGGEAVESGALLGVGSYTVTITSSLELVGDTTYTYTVTATVVTLEWNYPSDLTYNGAAHTLTAEVTNKVEGDDVNAVVTLNGKNVDVTEEGFTYTVTGLAGAAAGNYTIEGADNRTSDTQYVQRATLTVQFAGTEGLVYSGKAHSVTATATGWVNGEEQELSALIVIGGDDTQALNAGNYTATITKAALESAHGNYTLSQDATAEFTVGKATLTLTVKDGADLSREYDGTATEVTAFVSENYFTVEGYVDNDDVYALLDAALASGEQILNADKYTVNITLDEEVPGAGNYTCETLEIPYEVTAVQLKATISVPEGGLTYDGTDKLPDLVINVEGNTEIAGAPQVVATVAGGAMVNAGTYTVTLQLQSDGEAYSGVNYNLTAQATQIDIAKRIVEVSWSAGGDLTYNGAEHTLTAEVTNKVEGDEVNAVVEVTGDNVKVTEKGFTYTITELTGAAADNYTIEGAENLTSATQNITPATLKVEWTDTQFTYDGREKTPSAAIAEGALIEGDEVTITVSGGKTDANVGGQTYTATATITGGDDMNNYVLDKATASTTFTIAPATLNLTIQMNEGTSGAGVAKPFTWSVSDKIEVAKTDEGWTLTSGGNSYKVTVSGGDGVEGLLDMLILTLNGNEYTGTPYGTKVENGILAVASSNTNYKVQIEEENLIVINIVPSLSVDIVEGKEQTVTYDANKTYTADGFADYFEVATTGGSEPPAGTWAYSVTGVEGSFANVGEYTVTATYTLTEGGVQLTNSFTFTITQATVKNVALDGASYTYGDLKAGDQVSVTVTYSDGEVATLNASFTADFSTGGYVKAGESVTLTLTGDDGANANYAEVNGQVVTVSVAKFGVTASLSYQTTQSEGGVLTLTYSGEDFTANITVALNGVLSGDVVEAALGLETGIIDASTYNDLAITLSGDGDNYEISNTGSLSVVVNPKEITVVWSGYENLTYDGEEKVITAAAAGTFGDDEVTLDVVLAGEKITEGKAVNAGDYTATVKAFTKGNYTLTADAVQPFTVAKAEATLAIENYKESVVYDGNIVTVTATLNGTADTENIVSVEIAYTAIRAEESVAVGEIRNAGSYTVTLAISNALNYKDVSEQFKITVNAAELDVTVKNNSFTYGDVIDLGASVSAIAGDEVTVTAAVTDESGAPAELKNAGTYTVKFALTGGAAGNYVISEETASTTVIISARALTFAWKEGQTFTYNGSAQTPEYTLEGVVEGDSVTPVITVAAKDGSTLTGGNAVNAGDYTASVQDITEGNYTLTGVQAYDFTIGKAELEITPSSAEFSDKDAAALEAYSSANYAGTIAALVTVTGVNGDRINAFGVTADNAYEGTLTVGQHTFTVTADSGNYNGAAFTVTVTEQQEIVLTATPSSTTYTGGEITFTFTAAGGSAEGVEVVIDSITYNGNGAESVLNAGSYTVTFRVTNNSTDNEYWYVAQAWTGTVAPAAVQLAGSVTAVYGDVYTTDGSVLGGRTLQFAVFNGTVVEVRVTLAQSVAADRDGETYLGADIYDVNVTPVSGNFVFEGGASNSTLEITRKLLNLAVQLPDDLTYTPDGIVIGIADYAAQLVGSDELTVTMLVDGQPYAAGETVLGAGEHTVTYSITSENYEVAQAATQTFTVSKKEVSSSITVSGEVVEDDGRIEIESGENAQIGTAIENYLASNGVAEGEYTLTVTAPDGQAADLENISEWVPGTYVVSVALGENYDGGMTFSIVVGERTTAQVPEAPTLPSTPLEGGSSAGTTDWLFPLIIAIECLIAVALIVTIVVTAIKRSKKA